MELVAPIDNTFGALLIGNYIGLVMYGTTAYQAYKYFQTYPKDTAILKCLGAVTSGENIRPYSSFVLRVYKLPSYFYLVTNSFNPSALLAGSWSAILMGVVMSLTPSMTLDSMFGESTYVVLLLGELQSYTGPRDSQVLSLIPNHPLPVQPISDNAIMYGTQQGIARLSFM
ncbi:hypothetical protein BD309DRAFT_980160, partial [Dichomitus squalens]